MKSILGLLRPQQGDVMIDGARPDDGNLRYWQREIGYIPRHIYLSDDRASNIAFGIRHADTESVRVEQAARIANIYDFIAATFQRATTR